MAESKSAALTSLATPQALNLLQQRRERMTIQPAHGEAAHLRGHPGQDRARRCWSRFSAWGVAKLVKAADFDSAMRGFESFLPSHQISRRGPRDQGPAKQQAADAADFL